MPVLHLLLNSWASGFRIKATQTNSLGVFAKRKILSKRGRGVCPRGEGDFVPEGESQGDGSISGLLWGHFQKSQG